ncbi:peptide-methionine (S)-S-oxide reductase MsrA [Mesoplasma lactucae]|uniref:Peptide methionine sulfoxide reductase MsrA n=1 Tax=Mesoplasma lactucae ATCC 49193 TaxID=81460 RepID=A0A291IQZ5_9MOLU|nr:peptide-methionine (S)-S-oxide reductase MsrA [Mesoplasma lactucae]ATG97365.1 peptide-methionine (S)-S-oxide reductase [Mesoplasma lactucae ATCC 49193]ATZ20183.1 peptide methionine sulfoxide reductase [Mesoplasma lactucae ATCC 49193]MCL8216932.1 Peptide methionine sulfoxide reductase MsrA [Mesoplasma lactucae ATCC 49193]
MKKIYLAGGCFWGPQAAFDLVKGVTKTVVGYAQSIIDNPSYEEVCTGLTRAAETVEVTYDESIIDLKGILDNFFKMINPTTLNRQGPDAGTQYRTGIYSTDEKDLEFASEYIQKYVQPQYRLPVVVQVQPLVNFYPAENYHQEFLKKNPNRHCNIDLSQFGNNK